MIKLFSQIFVSTLMLVGCDYTNSPSEPSVPPEVQPYLTQTQQEVKGVGFIVKALSSQDVLVEQSGQYEEHERLVVFLFPDRVAVIITYHSSISGGLINPPLGVEKQTHWSFKDKNIEIEGIGSLEMTPLADGALVFSPGDDFAKDHQDLLKEPLTLRMQTETISELR